MSAVRHWKDLNAGYHDLMVSRMWNCSLHSAKALNILLTCSIRFYWFIWRKISDIGMNDCSWLATVEREWNAWKTSLTRVQGHPEHNSQVCTTNCRTTRHDSEEMRLVDISCYGLSYVQSKKMMLEVFAIILRHCSTATFDAGAFLRLANSHT